tara:strand:- start:15 stop:905 length:891 start_codon:yes stop_codon:yes gene_type:complete
MAKSQVVNPDYPDQDRLTDEELKRKVLSEAPVKSAANTKAEQGYKFPTETIELPSKGLLYPAGSALSQGKVDVKYMTAKEEDILTSQNLIKNGTVIDRLLRSLIVSPINYNDLLVGDKNAIMVAARILAYGKEYKVELTDPNTGDKQEEVVDLTQFEYKEFSGEGIEPGENRFVFNLPAAKRTIEFRLLCHGDEQAVQDELKRQKKTFKGGFAGVKPELSTRLRRMILSVDGESDPIKIRNFVDNEFLSRDSLAFREHIEKISPDIDLTYSYYSESTGEENEIVLPMSVQFFWPRA